jgi:hypothetical protein
LYYILGDTYPDASEEELEEIFEEMLENMSEQQAEDFMSSLGSIGKKIGSGLAQVPNFLGKNPELLSTIGGIAGNLILPGAGGMIGGALGSAAGGLLQNKNAQNNLQQQQQQNPNAIVNPDAAKLNSLMQDPQMQRALMQMSTSNVPIAPLTSNGQTTHVPIANFLHALIRQAQAALQQLDALIPPQVQEALAENFGEDFAGEDLGEALLEEVRVNGGWGEEEEAMQKKFQSVIHLNNLDTQTLFNNIIGKIWGNNDCFSVKNFKVVYIPKKKKSWTASSIQFILGERLIDIMKNPVYKVNIMLSNKPVEVEITTGYETKEVPNMKKNKETGDLYVDKENPTKIVSEPIVQIQTYGTQFAQTIFIPGHPTITVLINPDIEKKTMQITNKEGDKIAFNLEATLIHELLSHCYRFVQGDRSTQRGGTDDSIKIENLYRNYLHLPERSERDEEH